MSINKSRLSGHGLFVGYGTCDILKDVSIEIPHGQVTVLIGANACGKSTLLKAISRLIKPRVGLVSLDGKSLHHYGAKELARVLGILPQSPIAPEGIVVADLIARGRFPYQKRFSGLSQGDYDAVESAMGQMGILDIANKDLAELSGGQRQRVWIAMALAQETDILVLDEPTTYLDIAHQVEILDLLQTINQQKKTTIVMVLHDINLAARYADHMIAVKGGKIFAQGVPSELITSDLIEHVFDLKSLVICDPVSHTPLVVPMGVHHHLTKEVTLNLGKTSCL